MRPKDLTLRKNLAGSEVIFVRLPRAQVEAVLDRWDELCAAHGLTEDTAPSPSVRRAVVMLIDHALNELSRLDKEIPRKSRRSAVMMSGNVFSR